MSKLYMARRGSCRGDSFQSDESISLDVAKRIVRMYKENKSEDKDEELESIIDQYTGNYDIFVVVNDSIVDELKEFEKILKKGEGYLAFEEYSVGFGKSIKEAKLNFVDGMDEDGCW